jgi:4Fe-4S ferredoxin
MNDLNHHWKEQIGLLTPVIDFNSCETSGFCLAACPYDVLEMVPISDAEMKALTFFGKLKTRLNGKEKAYVVNANHCNGCGLCVAACPEKAITMAQA